MTPLPALTHTHSLAKQKGVGLSQPQQELELNPRRLLRPAATCAAFVSVICIGMLISPATGRADDDNESRIRQGFSIVPKGIKLNLERKNRALVGLGSYLVNGVGGCNDCHTNPPYAVGGDPFMGQPKQESVATYLGGGNAFGPFLSRNLTPDKTGRPLGGRLF